jgi:integrase
MAVIVREKVKGSGEWWVFINHKGKRRSKKIGDKRTANTVARKVRQRLAAGDLGMLKEETPTIAKYGGQWFLSPHHEWADGTRDNYGSAFTHHIEPALGERRLDEVGRKEVKALIGSLKQKDLSKGRIELIVQTLRNIFNEAIDDQLLSANPCDRVGKYNKGRRKGKNDPLTTDEVTTMLENAHKTLSFTLYSLFLLAVMSGLRIGEILALEWNDFDFDERTVDVTKNWDYTRLKMGPPKNNKPRKVDLPPVVVDTMRELRANQKVVTLKEIFVDDKGKRLKHKPVYRALHKVAPRKIRIHDLRHTYATLRVAKGDNIVDVSAQLGHHDPGFTLKRYAHWMPGEHKSQVDELGNLAPKRTLYAP